MPNVEIHGFESSTELMASKAKSCLRSHFSPMDVVITKYNDKVVDLRGNERPYFRVVCNDEDEAQEAIDLLSTLKKDIEVLLLHDFIPATQ